MSLVILLLCAAMAAGNAGCGATAACDPAAADGNACAHLDEIEPGAGPSAVGIPTAPPAPGRDASAGSSPAEAD